MVKDSGIAREVEILPIGLSLPLWTGLFISNRIGDKNLVWDLWGTLLAGT